jgi:carbamoyltransferase
MATSMISQLGVFEFVKKGDFIAPLQLPKSRFGKRRCYLGIAALTHDTSVSLVDSDSGEILYAQSEERFSNVKHDSGFPIGCVKIAIEQLENLNAYIEKVCVNFDPHLFIKEGIFKEIESLSFESKRLLDCDQFYSSVFQELFDCLLREGLEKVNTLEILSSNVARIGSVDCEFIKVVLKKTWRKHHWYLMLFFKYQLILWFIKQLFPNLEIIPVRHHLSHAASALYSSGKKNNIAMLILDGHGETDSCSTYHYQNGVIHELSSPSRWPHSLGGFYLAVTRYLGFDFGDEYKVMGMSAYGKPRYLELLRTMVKFDSNLGTLRMEDCEEFKLDYVGDSGQVRFNFTESMNFFLKPRDQSEELFQEHFDLAASTQCLIEECGVKFAKFIRENSDSEYIALAGGVALNGLMNNAIAKTKLFKDVWVFPAASDEGTSAGAAMYQVGQFGERLGSVFFGPVRERDEILEELISSGLAYQEHPQINREIAKLLSKKKIVARFTGRSEFGPRALGNRSILAGANFLDMKDILNIRIKQRESFRPFAPAILEELAKDFFDLNDSSPFMLRIVEAQEKTKLLCPAIVHEDGTSRVQTVSKRYNTELYSILEEYNLLTGIPILLNTSFNVNGETIVETPLDAIESFLHMDIDYLAIGDYLVSKSNLGQSLHSMNQSDYLDLRRKRYLRKFEHSLQKLDCRVYSEEFFIWQE